MKDNEPAVRFRHHFLNNEGVLTVATSLYHSSRIVSVGWAMYNPNDRKWVRKLGVHFARGRLENYPLFFTLTDNEPIVCDYISLRALWVILTSRMSKSDNYNYPRDEHPSCIPDSSAMAIYDECFYVSSLLGQRMKLDSLYEAKWNSY